MLYFCEMQQKIVLIGGPGTGKSTVLQELENKGFLCFPEVSREVTLKAQKEGIEQLFLTDPLLFSKMLLEGREKQFLEAEKSSEKIVFLDRGIPDVYAYLEYFKTPYPTIFKEKSEQYKYNKVFLFLPWKEIYTSDNERYEDFNQSQEINSFLIDAYREMGYNLISVPFGTVKERADFIMNAIAVDL